MGRLTKEMKKAELMEQLTEANETYLEKISQHMECQYREMQRVERRIERKKKLIDKKYIVSIKKLKKERKEKLKKIVGRYRRIGEKVREATIDKVDLAEIENIEKGYITLRQFLLNILREEVYKILNRCMAEEKTVRISRKAMLENSIARQRERLDKYIDLCADGIITKQELAERRKGLDAQIAELQSQYENVEQEDERSGTLDMNLIAQKLDEWQKA